MKTSEILLIGAVGVGALFMLSRGANANKDSYGFDNLAGNFPIQSTVTPTYATASYPISVSKTPSLKGDTSTQSIIIKEQGIQYVPSYKVVNVGTAGKSLKGGGVDSGKVIAFDRGGSMGMSEGFYKKAKSIGIVD